MGIFTQLNERYKKSKIGILLKSSTVRRIIAGFLFYIIITGILSINFMPQRINLEKGQPSDKDIKAPSTVKFIDEIQTAEVKKKALESVLPVYIKNTSLSIGVERNLSNFFNRFRNIQAQDAAEDEKIALLKEQIKPVELREELILSLLKEPPATLNKLEETTDKIILGAMDRGIKKEELSATKKELIDKLPKMNIKSNNKAVIRELINKFLQGDVYIDVEETKKSQLKAQDEVAPVMTSVKQNEIIIREGEIVTEEHLMKLEALGLLKTSNSAIAVVGLFILVLLVIVLTMLYLYQYRPDIYYNESLLLLLGLITTLTLVISKMIIAIKILESPIYNSLLGYLIPVATASMLIAILLDTRLAILVTIVLAVVIGILTGNQLRFAIVSFVSGIAGVYSVSRLSQRSDLAKAGMVYISSATALTIIGTEMTLNNSFVFSLVIFGIILGLSNGLLSSVFTIGALPYLETGFGITSAVKLLELSNPNHPLLKRLLVEAPGTYHHSIIVGNLAEAAANEVGGEPLLVRVGAYYHDIGKVRRPYFFIENQLASDNPHDKLAPSLSTLIVTSHIKDGVEMAKEHKLPQVILDIIEQHHGKSLMTYFYHKAVENDPHETVAEDDFRYEGPKPQTKEAALVMLADTVEAAVRSLQKPTPGRVEGIVRKLIKEKLNDGQFDECDLTFKDLNLIALAFIRVLSGIYHQRIEYPENVIKEMERRKG